MVLVSAAGMVVRKGRVRVSFGKGEVSAMVMDAGVSRSWWEELEGLTSFTWYGRRVSFEPFASACCQGNVCPSRR